ncbi:Tetratricopeptide TPR_2 repeat protein [Olavius algarvensis associated proteobacterium Delta 3]|nr:Tetratricopeptide TPR_2 repeat protein [Olavius algarvensis associated proteobacterium Delta 3]
MTHVILEGADTLRNGQRSDTAADTAIRVEGKKPSVWGAGISRHRILLLCMTLLLVAAIVLVYRPVKDFEFLDFDDDGYVTGNVRVPYGLTWKNIRWAFTTSDMSNWHPLTWISHMADCQLFGLNAGAHHQTNVLIHVVNSVLLLWLVYRMTGAVWKSAFVAALFALHPLHVESVAWISERKDLLSTFFGFLAVYVYIGYARQKRGSSYIISLLCYALSILAKPMMVTLPFLLLLFDFWPLERVHHVFQRTEHTLRTWTGLVIEKIPFFCISALSSVMTVFAQTQAGAVKTLDAFPLDVRVFNAIVAYLQYLIKTVWPRQLAGFYPHPGYSLGPGEVFSSLIALAGISYLAVRQARKRPYFFVGWFGYLGMLVPVIGLVQVGSQAMADRYSYLPLIGLFIIAAWGLPELLAGRRHGKAILRGGGILALIMLGVLSARQVGHWRDTKTLSYYILSVTQDNVIILNSLGAFYTREGKLEKAEAYLRRSLYLKPQFGLAHNNMGIVQSLMGRTKMAIFHHRQAIRYDPHRAMHQYNYAVILVRQKRFQEALDRLSETLRIDPNFADAYVVIGMLLMQSGKNDDAADLFRHALEINPIHADAKRFLSSME